MTDMQVYLDDAPCDVNTQSVAHAIAEAAERAEQAGRMIIEVLVDGHCWSEEQLSAADAMTAVARELRMTTIDPADLVRETINQAREALDNADDLQRTAAELLQQDARRDAMSKLEDAISIWMSVQDAACKCAELLGMDLTELASDYIDPQGAMNRLSHHLTQVRQALLDDDQVTLSDTLLYELPDVVDEWKSLLSALGARAADGDFAS